MDSSTSTPAVLDHDDIMDDEKISATHAEAVYVGKLTEEELAIEKRLVRKVDLLIMPLVVTVYLMNYIDRYAFLQSARQGAT